MLCACCSPEPASSWGLPAAGADGLHVSPPPLGDGQLLLHKGLMQGPPSAPCPYPSASLSQLQSSASPPRLRASPASPASASIPQRRGGDSEDRPGPSPQQVRGASATLQLKIMQYFGGQKKSHGAEKTGGVSHSPSFPTRLPPLGARDGFSRLHYE